MPGARDLAPRPANGNSCSDGHESEQLITRAAQCRGQGLSPKIRRGARPDCRGGALQEHRTFFTLESAEVVLEGYLRGMDLRWQRGLSRTPDSRERQVLELLAGGKTTKEVRHFSP